MGEIETEHPGYLGAQDTYYVGTIKGIGRIYQQTFIDTYSKVATVKIYDRKNALVAADTLNDKVVCKRSLIPFTWPKKRCWITYSQN